MLFDPPYALTPTPKSTTKKLVYGRAQTKTYAVAWYVLYVHACVRHPYLQRDVRESEEDHHHLLTARKRGKQQIRRKTETARQRYR